MNEPKSQPVHSESTVLYRCSCGTQLSLRPSVGGTCFECKKDVSPKVLRHDLALTMTIQTDVDPSQSERLQIDLAQTRADGTMSEDPDFLIGKTFGHFEIVATLGSGGMGQVYRALDKSLQRYVAVKILRSGIGSTAITSSSESEIDALLQEAVSQARVTHPNIVTIYYVGKQDGDPFLAMELINGNPLSKLIDARKLTFSHIAPIAIQIARALQFSHQLDIIHGDIKPSNILVQTNGLTKLSDFGMARSASDDQTGRFGGTPNYLAPELLTGSKPTIQSDMYGLGVTLYEMTFGKLPVALSGHTVADWIESHDNQDIYIPSPWPENFPESWRDLIIRLLAQDPADRFGNYEELLETLEKTKPESRIIARRTPRLIAAVVDWLSVLLLMAPVQLAMGIFDAYFSQHVVVEFFVRLTDFVPITIYTVALFFWRQSIGRALMHVRVVNQYGLVPSRNTMVLRSFLRMCGPWFACVLIFFDAGSVGWINVVENSILVAGVVFLLLDIAFMMIYENARSLHDLIFGTRVVLDTD